MAVMAQDSVMHAADPCVAGLHARFKSLQHGASSFHMSTFL